MENNYGKVGLLAGAISFMLLVIGVRNVLGETIEILNFIAFAVFSIIIGLSCTAMLFYKLRIAFPMFIIALLIAYFEMYRSFLLNVNDQGNAIGILSLFIFTSFGLAIALIVQFIVMYIRKNK